MEDLSFLARDSTHVPHTTRQILNHQTTREVLQSSLVQKVIQGLVIILGMKKQKDSDLPKVIHLGIGRKNNLDLSCFLLLAEASLSNYRTSCDAVIWQQKQIKVISWMWWCRSHERWYKTIHLLVSHVTVADISQLFGMQALWSLEMK